MLGAMAADSMARRRRKVFESSSFPPPPVSTTTVSDVPTQQQSAATTPSPPAAPIQQEDMVPVAATPHTPSKHHHSTLPTHTNTIPPPPSGSSFPFHSRLHGRIGLDVSSSTRPIPIHQGLSNTTASPFSTSSNRIASSLPPSCPLCTEAIKGGISMVDHMEKCPQNTRSCPACKGAVQVAAIDDHYLNCPRNTWPCFLCNKPVQMSRYVSHCSSCEAGSGTASQGCPTRMYHGTTYEAAAAILSTRRFELSDKGLLGVGVYVSRDVRKAMRYGPCVVECAVFQGKTVVIRERHHPLQKCWHKAKGYDSAWIPPDSFVLTQRATLEDDDPSVAVGTRGQTGGDLEEHCVADPRRVYPLHIVKFVH